MDLVIEELAALIFVPVVLFILVVAPIWLILHYRERRRERERRMLPEAGRADVELAELAERMEKRIAALETLLDAEAPDWRARRE